MNDGPLALLPLRRRRLADVGAAPAAALLFSAFAFIGYAPGCQGADESPPLSCEPSECPCKTADPTPRCVRLVGCSGGRDCPAGTLCAPASDGDGELTGELASCASGDAQRAARTRCVLAPESESHALVNGFRVNEFLLDPLGDTSAFAFVPPTGSRIIACALFGCEPDVRLTRTDVAGQPAGEIVNYAQCALSGDPQTYIVSEQSATAGEPFAFTPSVAEPTTAAGADVCADAEEIAGSSGRMLTEISAGCWAYDDTRLIAATRLVPLAAEHASALNGLLSSCEGSSKDALGGSCFLDAHEPPLAGAPLLGSCVEDACRPRCVTAADCPKAMATKDCLSPMPSCFHPSARSFVGACFYERCDRDELLDAGAQGDGGAP